MRLAHDLTVLVPIGGYLEVELDARISHLCYLVRLNVCDALDKSSIFLLDLFRTRPTFVRRSKILGLLGHLMSVQRPRFVLLE